MDFLKETEQYIHDKTLFSKEDRVFVACSGGADSLTLLYALKKLGYTVSAGYVHHGLRAAADRDEQHVKQCCESWEIPFCSAHVDVHARVRDTGESVEEAARNLRYEALFSMCEAQRCTHLAIAHHAEDNAETVLFHMIRGSGLRGLSGVAPKSLRTTRKNGCFSVTLVRPFLFATKGEIAAYAAKNGLIWVEDETNGSDAFTRNKIRHTVLPALAEIRADSAEKILETSEFLRAADAYLIAEAEAFLRNESVLEEGALYIPCAPFLQKAEILQQYILRAAFRQLSVPMKDKTKRHIESLRALFQKKPGARSTLPGGLTGRRLKEGVRIQTAQEKATEGTDGKPQFGTLKMVRKPFKKTDKIPDSLYTKWVDCDKIKGDLFVRSRTAGDRICLTPGTTKKLQEYFIDEKIPAEERDLVPIVTDGQSVIWIVGHRLSADAYVTENTKTILEITYEERENNERKDQYFDFRGADLQTCSRDGRGNQ